MIIDCTRKRTDRKECNKGRNGTRQYSRVTWRILILLRTKYTAESIYSN